MNIHTSGLDCIGIFREKLLPEEKSQLNKYPKGQQLLTPDSEKV
jgi:hypothetical protein